MSVQLLLNDIPKDTEIESPSLGATVIYTGGLFFLDGVQTELLPDEINDLHSDVMLSDMQPLNEFQPGLFYQL